MNKKSIYISGILITLLFSACGGGGDKTTENIENMQPPESAYIQKTETNKNLTTKETITQSSNLRELLLNKQYYITLKDQDNNLNHFSWKFTKDGINSTKLNGYTTTTTIPYQINENILSMSINDQSRIFTFEAEDSDYLIFEDKDKDIRFYNSVEKSTTFFTNLKEDSQIINKPTTQKPESVIKSNLEKILKGKTFFLPATKNGKKALFKLEFGIDGMVKINGIEGYELMIAISYYIDNNILKFNSDSRTFDSDQGEYLLFTDDSRMYKNQSKAKIYLDKL